MGTPADTLVHRTPEPPPPSPPAWWRRRSLAWLGVLVVGVSAVIGSNTFAVRDRIFGTATPDAAPPAVGRTADPSVAAVAPVPAAPTSLRSQPWWQHLASIDGTGTTTTAPVTIADEAIQWRVTWSCRSGRLVVRSPKQSRPVVNDACPEGAVGYGRGSGPVELEVSADGPWHLEVAQQISAPLVEPPLPEMTAPGAAAVLTGRVYDIDKTGVGTVTVYRQADGRYSLRLADFFVSPTADLELRLSPLAAPKTTREYLNGPPSELISVMDVTAGSLNYPIPAGIDPTRFGSLVIWCGPVNSAYAAASLGAA